MEGIMLSDIKEGTFKKIFLFFLFFILMNNIVLGFSAQGNNKKDLRSLETNMNPPVRFDLRDVDGKNCMTSVKDQQGGTCWAFASVASMESNLLVNDNWIRSDGFLEPDLDEYHMSWWNGFNIFNNDDNQQSDGVDVHAGGNWKMASAYLSRGDGSVMSNLDDCYYSAPERTSDEYIYYYARDIEWLTAERDLSRIDEIKNKIMTDGGIATVISYDERFLDDNFTFYQPYSSDFDLAAHAVTIIGWDDETITQAEKPGAWLCKNSWGIKWAFDGCFWISYYDKVCCQDPELGAACYNNCEPMKYDNIYYHDYHGWRGTFKLSSSVMNRFIADNDELLEAVSFFTASEDVDYTVKIFDGFEKGKLVNELSKTSGFVKYIGFHTIDLAQAVELSKGDEFYICLELSKGGYPFDRTSVIWRFLSGGNPLFGFVIKSTADWDESYFKLGPFWIDMHIVNPTANFCIKGLTNKML